jgi:hypothetical protein
MGALHPMHCMSLAWPGLGFDPEQLTGLCAVSQVKTQSASLADKFIFRTVVLYEQNLIPVKKLSGRLKRCQHNCSEHAVEPTLGARKANYQPPSLGNATPAPDTTQRGLPSIGLSKSGRPSLSWAGRRPSVAVPGRLGDG